MMNNQVNPDYTLLKIIESLAEVVSQDEKLTDEYLKSAGLDPKEIEASGNKFLGKLKGKIRIEQASQQQEKYLKIRETFLFQKGKLAQNAKETIASLLSQGDNVAYQSYFRKLDKLTENDCNQIRDEQDFLDFLDKMD